MKHTKTLTTGSKACLWAGCVCVLHVVGMLVFRGFIYSALYKLPSDPYGLADIIELVLWVVFVGLLGLSVLLSLVLWFKGNSQSKQAATVLAVLSVLLYVGYSPLRQLVAQWAV